MTPTEPSPATVAVSQQRPIREEKLLLVEGREEQRFWSMLLPARGKTGYQVEEYGGKTGLTKALRALRPIRGFGQIMWLGIMRDADDNPRVAFESVRDSLRSADLPRPARPWFTTSGTPAVTAFILPDGSSEGDLEELVWRCLTASDDKAVACVETYLACLDAAGIALPRQMSKARVHAYLASRPQPDLRLGDAAANSQLAVVFHSPALDDLLRLLP